MGWEKVVVGKWRQLYLNNSKKKKKIRSFMKQTKNELSYHNIDEFQNNYAE